MTTIKVALNDSSTLFLQCTASTAKMCIYGLLSFVITSFEEESLQVCSFILYLFTLWHLYTVFTLLQLTFNECYRPMVWQLSPLT